jgi:hypothetical protein
MTYSPPAIALTIILLVLLIGWASDLRHNHAARARQRDADEARRLAHPPKPERPA